MIENEGGIITVLAFFLNAEWGKAIPEYQQMVIILPPWY